MIAGVLVLVLWAADPPRAVVVNFASGRAPASHPAAQQEALDNACREVLTTALSRVGEPPSEALKLEAGRPLEDLLRSPCSRLASYSTGKPEVFMDEVRVVLTNAVVRADPLFHEYQALLEQVAARPHPRVLFLLSETSGKGETERAWWVGSAPGTSPSLHFSMVEQDESARLSARGWHVVSPEVATAGSDGKVVIQASHPTIEGAVAYAKRVGVDYVVLGGARFLPLESHLGASLFAESAQLEARVARTGSGDVVAGVQKQATATSVASQADALVRAGQLVAAALDVAMAGAVLDDWKQHQSGAAKLAIQVASEDYGPLAQLVELIKAQPGVRAVTAGDFQAGQATIEVEGDLVTPRRLAAALSRPQPNGLKVGVQKVSATELSLKLGP